METQLQLVPLYYNITEEQIIKNPTGSYETVKRNIL